MSNFSIHLSEPLSESEAKRVAQLTAPALGGSPEKLQLLLGKQPGSRIARAVNQRQAETVANILRSAGVKVDVLENAADGSVLPPTASVPPAIAASAVRPNDLFAAPVIPPLNPEVTDPFSALKPDPFAAPKSDPFAAPKSEPFAAPKSDPLQGSGDPFGIPKAPPVGNSDPFAAPKSDPFAAPKSDPFSAPKSDPFSAPKSDPFAAPKSDPFAAPKSDPLATRSNSVNADPFAAPGMSVVVDNKEVALTDLPSQARKARDRAMPRSSVRTQMLFSLIIPYVLVAVGTIAFMFYQLPQIYRQELGLRTYQAAVGEAESNFEIVERLPDQTALKELQAEATEDLDQIPEAVAIIYEAEILELSSTNGAVAAVASTNNMTFAEAQELEEQFKSLEGQGLRFGPITFRGELLIGSIAEIKEENNQSSPEPSANETENAIGEVHVLFSQSEIFNRVIQAIIPLLVALGIIFIFALFLANALATRLARPIISATDQANRIALGDLDRTVVVETNDEIGDMLGSLERMRVSLKSMVARMRRNT